WPFVFFFFSSRRRHTRFSRDWSSDVCSSDLPALPPTGPELVGVPGLCATARTTEPAAEAAECRLSNVRRRALARGEAGDAVQDHGRGRAACVAGEVPGVWVDVGQGTTRAVARSAAA